MVNFEQKDWKLYSGEQVRQYVPLRSTDSHLNGGKKHFEMHCTDRYGYKDHLFSEEREKIYGNLFNRQVNLMATTLHNLT